MYERDKELERVHIPGPIKEGVIVYVSVNFPFKGRSYHLTIEILECLSEVFKNQFPEEIFFFPKNGWNGPKKLKFPLSIKQVIYRGKFKNAGIAYNYTVPKTDIAAEKQYEWSFSDWSACSATCGTGVQTAEAVCKEHRMGPVEESRCLEQEKPDNKMRVCNTHQCPTR